MTTQVDMIGLVVDDLQATTAFYRLLGLEIPAFGPDEKHVEVITPNGYRIAFDAIEMIRGFNPAFEKPSGSNRISLAFLCKTPAEVDALYARVTAAGNRSHKAPWDAFWGQRYATVLDPDGNTVDLFAPLAAPAHDALATRAELAEIATRWLGLWNPPFDRAAFDALHSEDFVAESSAGRPSDRDAYRISYIEGFLDAFPDSQTRVESLVIDEAAQQVAVRWSLRGTNRKRYLGIGPTHRETAISGIEIIDIRAGRVVRRWGEWDITNHFI
jgi:steroid delta-isomerase-like uncharacterized protein